MLLIYPVQNPIVKRSYDTSILKCMKNLVRLTTEETSINVCNSIVSKLFLGSDNTMDWLVVKFSHLIFFPSDLHSNKDQFGFVAKPSEQSCGPILLDKRSGASIYLEKPVIVFRSKLKRSMVRSKGN